MGSWAFGMESEETKAFMEELDWDLLSNFDSDRYNSAKYCDEMVITPVEDHKKFNTVIPKVQKTKPIISERENRSARNLLSPKISIGDLGNS